MNISVVNKDDGLMSFSGNFKFSDLNLEINQLVTLLSGLPINPFDLIQKILGGSVKTLAGSVKTLAGIPSMITGKPSDTKPILINYSIKAFTSSVGKEIVATYGSNTKI